MSKKIVPICKLKKLIPGSQVEEGLTGFYGGVPDKFYKGKVFKIVYNKTVYLDDNSCREINIEKLVEDWNRAERFRRFMDKWGRGAYTLGYFKMCESLED